MPETCPPWWPELIWWLLHHRHPEPPEPWKKLREPIEEILVALTTYVEAQAFFSDEQEKLRAPVQQSALEHLGRAVEQLREITQ
jgi:hypothetical protein